MAVDEGANDGNNVESQGLPPVVGAAEHEVVVESAVSDGGLDEDGLPFLV